MQNTSDVISFSNKRFQDNNKIEINNLGSEMKNLFVLFYFILFYFKQKAKHYSSFDLEFKMIINKKKRINFLLHSFRLL